MHSAAGMPGPRSVKLGLGVEAELRDAPSQPPGASLNSQTLSVKAVSAAGGESSESCRRQPSIGDHRRKRQKGAPKTARNAFAAERVPGKPSFNGAPYGPEKSLAHPAKGHKGQRQMVLAAINTA